MNYHTIFFCAIINDVIHKKREFSLQQEVDWSYLVNLAKQHNLLPIFIEGASKYLSYLNRSEYGQEMTEALFSVVSQVNRTDAFFELYKAFLESDIHPIVMKGLICRQLYGDLCDHRPSGDEDILVRISEYQKVKKVLLDNGYVTELEDETEELLEQKQEVDFMHPEKKLHIELHLNPMGRENDVRCQMSDCFLKVFDNYRDVDIDGVKVRTMGHQDHILFLILHTFKHFLGGGFGIRQVLDILLYLEQYRTEINMNSLKKTLQHFKADIFFSDIIHVGNFYLGFELESMQEPNCPEALLEDMMQCGVFGNGNHATRAAGRTVQFVTGECLKKKPINSFSIIWKSLFPKRVYLLDNSPYLQDKPWLLPVAWIERWGRFLKRTNKDNKLVIESIKISQRRMKLLKQYDLV